MYLFTHCPACFAEKKTEMAVLVCLMHYTVTDLQLCLPLNRLGQIMDHEILESSHLCTDSVVIRSAWAATHIPKCHSRMHRERWRCYGIIGGTAKEGNCTRSIISDGIRFVLWFKLDFLCHEGSILHDHVISKCQLEYKFCFWLWRPFPVFS